MRFRNQRRDELTTELIAELRKELNPTTQGLPGLDALYTATIGNGGASSCSIQLAFSPTYVVVCEKIVVC